jgi:small subunit ribosomal protein S5
MREMNIEQKPEVIEKIVSINRITKVTKGGKKMSFSALVVVGDRKGHVGFSLGKANEVADAIRKGLTQAKREMTTIKMEGSSIPHEVLAEFNAAKVLLKPASEGTGIIACAAVRAICEAAGIKDILTKSLKSNNPINVIKATMEGFSQLKG